MSCDVENLNDIRPMSYYLVFEHWDKMWFGFYDKKLVDANGIRSNGICIYFCFIMQILAFFSY